MKSVFRICKRMIRPEMPLLLTGIHMHDHIVIPDVSLHVFALLRQKGSETNTVTKLACGLRLSLCDKIEKSQTEEQSSEAVAVAFIQRTAMNCIQEF